MNSDNNTTGGNNNSQPTSHNNPQNESLDLPASEILNSNLQAENFFEQDSQLPSFIDQLFPLEPLDLERSPNDLYSFGSDSILQSSPFRLLQVPSPQQPQQIEQPQPVQQQPQPVQQQPQKSQQQQAELNTKMVQTNTIFTASPQLPPVQQPHPAKQGQQQQASGGTPLARELFTSSPSNDTEIQEQPRGGMSQHPQSVQQQPQVFQQGQLQQTVEPTSPDYGFFVTPSSCNSLAQDRQDQQYQQPQVAPPSYMTEIHPQHIVTPFPQLAQQAPEEDEITPAPHQTPANNALPPSLRNIPFNFRPSYICGNCGISGHNKRGCENYQQLKAGGRLEPRSRYTCGYCKQRGHNKRSCSKLKEDLKITLVVGSEQRERQNQEQEEHVRSGKLMDSNSQGASKPHQPLMLPKNSLLRLQTARESRSKQVQNTTPQQQATPGTAPTTPHQQPTVRPSPRATLTSQTFNQVSNHPHGTLNEQHCACCKNNAGQGVFAPYASHITKSVIRLRQCGQAIVNAKSYKETIQAHEAYRQAFETWQQQYQLETNQQDEIVASQNHPSPAKMDQVVFETDEVLSTSESSPDPFAPQ